METFHLFHLAACWTGRGHASSAADPPLATSPVSPSLAHAKPAAVPPADTALLRFEGTTIRAAGAHMVFASRRSRDFITPEQVNEVEAWTGQASVPFLPFADPYSFHHFLSLSFCSAIGDEIWHDTVHVLSVHALDLFLDSRSS